MMRRKVDLQSEAIDWNKWFFTGINRSFTVENLLTVVKARLTGEPLRLTGVTPLLI